MNALQELALSTERAFEVECSVHCQTPIWVNDNAVATHLYRIAQEAIQNAIRHGKAKIIAIKFFAQKDRIELRVKDNGVGFIDKPGRRKGMGLRVMQYRAGTVGGSLVVEHEPDGGTSIVCWLPARSLRQPADQGTASVSITLRGV